MNYKKAQINQVFVYLLSIIIILFVGFLVVKFVMTFTTSVNQRANSKIYGDFKQDFNKVYSTYGSEEIFNFRVASNVAMVCFANRINNCQSLKTNISQNAFSDFNTTIQSNSNMALFSKDSIINSNDVGNLNIKNNCLCITPKNGILSIILSNNQNKVWIRADK